MGLNLPSSSTPKGIEATLNLCANSSIQEIVKCSFCERFLSVAPIYSHASEIVCGRCKFTNKNASDWTRQSLYETTAQFMIFPCSNVAYGCKVQLKWGEVSEHENTCLYKKLNCPFVNDHIFYNEKCRWTGSGPGLNDHLENCHGDQFKKLIEFNFTEINSNMIFLTRIFKQLMIVTLKFEASEKISCLIMVNGTSADCDAFRCQLELYDPNKRHTVVLRKSRLEDAVAFEENFVNDEKMLTVELPFVKNMLKNPNTVLGRFGIMKKSKKELERGVESSVDENLLRELECPICKNYMTAPISICSRGHSFCLRCKEQMDECPSCRRPFHEGRNYTLEKVTSCINFPCIYRDAGCMIVYPSERIKEHEKECTFSGTQCFLSPRCLTSTNMFKHLNDKHSDSLLVAGDIHILDTSDDDTKYYAMCFGNDIFRLVAVYSEDELKVSLQQFGVQQVNYSYEVEIVCCTESWRKIIVASECPPLDDDDIFDPKSVEVSGDMLEKFITDEELIFFKVHLKKVVI